MSYALGIQSEAVIDIQQGFEWYEMQRDGLGFDFIEEVESGFEKICQHPQFYLSVSEHLKRLKIKRFPYLIIYEIQKDTVIVNSVKHSSRKPQF